MTTSFKKSPVRGLFEKLTVAPNGCWLFTGNNVRGYGRLKVRGRSWSAHRYSYTLRFGVIPPGTLVCHRCDVPGCCNPDHLFLGTERDNRQDAMAKGRAVFPGRERFSHRTHCNSGHGFTAENTAVREGGARRCRECKNKRERTRYWRERNASIA